MSIYATELSFDADDHATDCAVWVPAVGRPKKQHRDGRVMHTDAGKFWQDDTKTCTCKAGPVRYEESHILPSDTDQRAGSMSLCAIPGFISRADRVLCGPDDECDEPATVCCRRVWPWLRLWVDDEHQGDDRRGSVVLLDWDQAAKVYRYLGDWLMRAGEQS